MTFSNKEREKQLSLLLIKMYIPVSNSSPYIRVTTQCKFPVLFVPSEANYLSDSVLRISLFLVNPYIRVTTQCAFPVLFVPSEARYLSDSVLRISLFLVNPYICRDQ